MKLISPFGPVKKDDTYWPDLFSVYRTLVARGDEITHGVLYSDLSPDHPEVRAALDKWEGTHFVFPREEGVEITLVRRIEPREPIRWWLHILLGLLTLVTTTIAGSYFAGRDPLALGFLPVGSFAVPYPLHIDLSALPAGLLFSLPLMLVLLCHEMGHYLLARRHRMDTSPPYFIPSPHWINLIGTFGAFIRLRSMIVNRIVLLDVGIAGPLVSFVLSLPLAALGLAWSAPLPDTMIADAPGRYLVVFGGQPIWLGGSPLFVLLDRIFQGDGTNLFLHPFAFAGWLGFFVTALNLFPLAQLDGGHILYALVGPSQRYAGGAFLLLLIALGFLWWGWWLWAGVILLIGRGSIRHPAVFDPAIPVTGRRRVLGWCCIAIFILTFVGVPITF